MVGNSAPAGHLSAGRKTLPSFAVGVPAGAPAGPGRTDRTGAGDAGTVALRERGNTISCVGSSWIRHKILEKTATIGEKSRGLALIEAAAGRPGPGQPGLQWYHVGAWRTSSTWHRGSGRYPKGRSRELCLLASTWGTL